MRTRSFFAVLAVALTAAAAGCGGSDDDENAASGTESDGGAATEERVVGYSNPQGSQVSLKSIGYGAQQAIEELGLPWKVNEIDAKLSADKQVSDIDTMITQKVDGIASWTLNSGAMEPAYGRAKEADIPVFGLNSESPSVTTNIKTETDSTCVVAEDQAKYIAERIPGAKVIAIEGPEVPSITYTTECFHKAAEAAGLDIIDSAADTAGTEANGQKVTETLLAKNKNDVQAVWVFADQTGVGSSAAIKEAGLEIWTEEKPSGVVVVSRDGAAAAMENIKQGLLTASWDGNMSGLGAAAVQLLQQHYVDGVPLEELPKEVVIKATRYDSTNVDDYVPELERDVPLPIQ